MRNPNLDRLQGAAHPALAEAIRTRKETILHRWQEMVVQHLPDADKLTLEGLRNSLPRTLEELAASLEKPATAPLADLLRDSQSHGVCRYHQSYNLNELLMEYGLLRGILIEEMLQHLGRAVRPEEMATLCAGLDEVMRRGIMAFVQHQKRQMQAATDAQSKYLAFLSHDMRGSLNGILLMVEVLRRELKDQPQFAASMADLELMRRSIMDTVGTMDRFLQAERLNKGKVPLQMERIDLDHLVRDVAGQFALRAANKGLALRSEIQGACQITTDREMILLVLQNVIGNAIKYTQQGTIRLRLQTDAQRCVISVLDQGPGIPPDRLEAIFAPFERGETFGQSGVGLGLAIARQAAELMGATLRAESPPGQGAAFHLEIPLVPHPNSPPETA